jgi:hypothetical protein
MREPDRRPRCSRKGTHHGQHFQGPHGYRIAKTLGIAESRMAALLDLHVTAGKPRPKK